MSENHRTVRLGDEEHARLVARTSSKVLGALVVIAAFTSAFVVAVSVPDVIWGIAAFGLALVITSVVVAALHTAGIAGSADGLKAALFGAILLVAAVAMYFGVTHGMFI